jgi:hypothetical protein
MVATPLAAFYVAAAACPSLPRAAMCSALPGSRSALRDSTAGHRRSRANPASALPMPASAAMARRLL